MKKESKKQKPLNRYFFLFLFVFCLGQSLSAQTINVTGVVSDGSGEPIIGATVSIKGASKGTITGLDGDFAISCQKGDVLNIAYMGYIGQSIKIESNKRLSIVLKDDSQLLEEVVVVGYGTQKKVNLVGSVGTVRVDEQLAGRNVSNVSSGLSGLVPGLAVTQGSGMAGNNEAALAIRGLGTVNNSNPLIVVDGMPDVDINRLNMNDIENISVLKDAASSAVYGSRAANGVILITTKGGKKNEKAKIEFSGSYGLNRAIKNYSWVNDYPRALMLLQQRADVNTLREAQIFKDGTIDQWMALGKIDPLRYPNTDWWDLVMRNGETQNYNVSASGGSDKSKFYISLGYMNEKGLQINNDFNRYNARFNLDYDLHKTITVGARFDGNWSKQLYSYDDGFTDGSSSGGDLRFAIAGITPYDPITGYYGGVMAYGESHQAFNPLVVYNNMQRHKDRQEANVNGYLAWTPIKNLTARVEYGLSYYNQFEWQANIPAHAYNFQTESFGARVYVGENAGVSNTTNTGYKTILNTRLNYGIALGDHDISAMFAYNEEYWYKRAQTGSRTDRVHESIHELDGASVEAMTAGGNSETEGLRSYIGRVNYAFASRYLLEMTFRVDGSSKFLKGHQYGFFPSAAFGWRFAEEEFIKAFTEKWLSNGKFRASYGSLGNNSGVKRYEQKGTLSQSNYLLDGSITKGLVNKKMVNQDLSWEKTSVINLGMDLGFFNNKLGVEFDYYDRLTTDMLRPSEMSNLLTGAYDAPRRNIGDLRNRGVELSLTWRDKIDDFSYSLNFNISKNKNRLEKWNVHLNKGKIFLDMPYNYLYMFETIGIAQTWEDVYNAAPQGASPGDVLYKDINGDGKIDDNDKVAYPDIMQEKPTTNYGFSGNFAWKGFDLSFLFQGTAGRKDFWLNNYNNTALGTDRTAVTWEQYNDYWSWEKRDNPLPRLGGGGKGNHDESSFWLDDMSYIRLKNIKMGYTLKKQWAAKLGLSKVYLYFTGENLLTITDFRGLDPEPSGSGSKNRAYPLVKSYSFGINIGI